MAKTMPFCVFVDVATIANVANGEVVPRPTLPLLPTTKSVLVDEPITKAGAASPFGFTESIAHGVEVPTPTNVFGDPPPPEPTHRLDPPILKLPLALNPPRLVPAWLNVRAPYAEASVPGPASRIRSPPLPASDEPEDNVSAPPFPEPDVFDPADIATLLPLRLAKLPPVSAIAPVLLIDKNVVVAVPVEDAIKRSDEAVSPELAKIANLESVLVAPIAKLPPTERLPVVVAPPAIVRPPVWVPLPMVDDAREYKPAVKPMRVLVAFAAVAPNVVVVKGNPNDDPLEVFMHTPPIEKHPCAKSIPRAKVDVAAVPVTLRYAVESPAVRVDVAGPVT
jgi:hypothetical protein